METYGIKKTHETLKTRLIDYITTGYFGKNDELRYICEEELKKQGVLWQEPYIEANPSYKVVPNGIANSTILSSEFKKILKGLEENKLGVFPNPYKHQVQALENYSLGKDILVATGTGSGKTECFMWPLATKLVSEAINSPQSWKQRGVRVIMLYPMNALVSDQMGRLRKMIGDHENKFHSLFYSLCSNEARIPQFGMYTGRTPFPGKRDKRAANDLAKTYEKDLLNKSEEVIAKLIEIGKYPSKHDLANYVENLRNNLIFNDPLDAELLTRWEMQDRVPDILITNYSMLEYMLMRQEEQSIWEETRRWLRSAPDNKLLFIIDEAHMYKGAAGGEVALLIRRFMEKLEIDRSHFQFILTSASVPTNDMENVNKFACDLTGAYPKNHQFAILLGEKEEINYKDAVKCEARKLADYNDENLHSEKRNESIIDFCEHAGLKLNKNDISSEDKIEQALYDALSNFEPLLKVMEYSRGNAIRFSELADKVFPEENNKDIREKALSNLLSIAPLAKNKEEQVLYPSRLHMMFRGLQGLYACSNPICKEKNHNSKLPIGKVYFGVHDDICECGGKIYELINERSCGALFYKGYIDVNEPSNPYLWNKKGILRDESLKEIHLFIPQSQHKKKKKNSSPVILNSLSGRLEENDNHLDVDHCVLLIKSEEMNDTECITFKSCPKCGKSNYLNLTDFVTKGNESFFNLVAEELAIQPAALTDLEKYPNGGRKVLLFSDSRQRAATLAKELTSVADEEAMKKAIVVAAKELEEWGSQNNFRPTMDMLYTLFLKVAYDHNLRFFYGAQEEKIKNDIDQIEKFIKRSRKQNRSLHYSNIKGKFDTEPELYWKYLLKHLCSSYRSLTDLGLCWIEPSKDALENVIDECEDNKFFIEEEDIRKIFSVWANNILTTKYAYSASIPNGVRSNITNIKKFGETDDNFKPYICKLMKENGYSEEDSAFLHKIFVNEFTSSSSGGGNEKFLNPNRIILKYGLDNDWYKCPNCGKIFPFTLWGKCARCGEGSPVKMGTREFEGVAFWRNPIIQCIEDKNALMMRINTEEHTAQLSHKDQRDNMWSTTEEYEMRFQNVDLDTADEKSGPVDVLSCTTTMEVGIDIGSLTAVGLRNIPPRRDNYQQRAGRAGRRSASISTIVTYTDNGPHDSYYFNHPERIISGEPNKPGIDVENARLLYRHLNVHYVDQFLKKINTDANQMDIISFVEQYSNSFIQFLNTYHWNQKHLDILVPTPNQLIVEELKEKLIVEFDQLSKKILNFKENYINTTNSRHKSTKSVLDVFLEEGIFPTFSFPRNVVDFNIETKDGSSLEQAPSRSLDLALSEYAPGRVLVVNKQTYKSGGIYNLYSKFNSENSNTPARPYFESRDYFSKVYYCKNKNCNWSSYEELENGKCPFCGGETIDTSYILKPWGFAPINGVNIREAEADMEISYAEEPSYSAPIHDEDMIQDNNYVWLRYAKLENQKMTIMNQGPDGNGFIVCKDCGAAIPGNTEKEIEKIHEPYHSISRLGKCHHTNVVNTFLGHQFITDLVLLEIRLDPNKINVNYDGLWINSAAASLSEALALGASQLLDIDFNDLKNGYRIRHDNQWTYIDIYLFDSLSSGAGYSSMLKDQISELFQETEKVLKCKKDCATACHDCLKHFWNQRIHNELDRHLANQLLVWCKTGNLPSELSSDAQGRLIDTITSYPLGNCPFKISKKQNKIYVEKGNNKKEIIVYPAMWNPEIIEKNHKLAISDKMILKALPIAYQKILKCSESL